MSRYGYTYLTYDTKRDMYYVGQHKSETYDPCYLGSGRKIRNVIKKRRDTLRNYILEWCESKEDLNESEIRWIAYFRDTEGYDKCYNLCDGGGVTSGFKFSPQQIHNLSESHRGHRHTDEHKRKISESLKRTFVLHPCNVGRKLTDEHRRKISDANKGKKRSEDWKNKLAKRKGKPVVQCSTNGTFIASYPSAREASRQTGIGVVSLCRCVNGAFKTSGGYVWYFENDYKNKIA